MKKLLLILVFISTYSFGGENSYNCLVTSVSDVKDNGEIRYYTWSNKGNDPVLSPYIGSTFSIDRKTGVIKGQIITNQSPNVEKTTILDSGNGMNSYQVLSIFGPNPSILYIRVKDYLPKSKNGEIPFNGFRWGESITGVCK